MTSQPRTASSSRTSNPRGAGWSRAVGALHQEYPSDLVEVIVVDGIDDSRFERRRRVCQPRPISFDPGKPEASQAAFAAGLQARHWRLLRLLCWTPDDRFLPNKLRRERHLDHSLRIGASISVPRPRDPGWGGRMHPSTALGLASSSRRAWQPPAHQQRSSLFPVQRHLRHGVQPQAAGARCGLDARVGLADGLRHRFWSHGLAAYRRSPLLPDCVCPATWSTNETTASIERGEYVHKAVWKERAGRACSGCWSETSTA